MTLYDENDLHQEEINNLIEKIRECTSVNKNCDCLLEHSDCDMLIERIQDLEERIIFAHHELEEHMRHNLSMNCGDMVHIQEILEGW